MNGIPDTEEASMTAPRPKLAVFLPGLYGGGAERTMLNLAQGIADRGYAVDLVLAEAVGPLLTEGPNSVRGVDLKATRTLWSLFPLVSYLRREHPAALLSALRRANVLAVLAQRLSGSPTKTIISERNTNSHARSNGRDWSDPITLILMRLVYRWASEVTSVSQGVADDLSRVAHIPRERIRVMYNPIVTPELRAKCDMPLQHKWFDTGQSPVILAVGSLTPQKDFTTLIRAFSHLRQSRKARLLILGEGPQRPTLERLVRRFGIEHDVSMPGWIGNPYPYMKRAALFVLSSRWEGLPGVLIEALYCGTPAVATDCPSGPREILADNQYGRLVSVGDVDALVDAMESGLTGGVPRPAKESWQPFELNSVVDNYIEILFGQ